MSILLYYIRLYWCNGRGGMRYYGHETCLIAPPKIEGLEYEEIDFAPECGTRLIRHRFGRLEDMRDDESQAAIRYLIGL